MIKYYIIENKSNYLVSAFRFVSLFNGARGPWTSKQRADDQGQKHQKIIENIYGINNKK